MNDEDFAKILEMQCKLEMVRLKRGFEQGKKDTELSSIAARSDLLEELLMYYQTSEDELVYE